MNLYPLKFAPILKETIWGGNRLKEWGKNLTPHSKVGESWEIATIDSYDSIVFNGYLAENSLSELIEVYMGEIVGDKVYEEFGCVFPLIVKLIDAANDLSIQVHPDDNYALQHTEGYGKTEMWFVLDAAEDATITIGLEPETDIGELQSLLLTSLEQSVPATDILPYFHQEKVKKADAILIESGMVHSLGKGVMVAEIQQCSDTTYRLYDYGRTDTDGNQRQLHIDEAFEVINSTSPHPSHINYSVDSSGNASLCSTPYFTVNLIQLNDQHSKSCDYDNLDSFVVYLCTEGEISILTENNEPVSIKKGETVLIPASLTEITLKTSCPSAQLLEVYV